MAVVAVCGQPVSRMYYNVDRMLTAMLPATSKKSASCIHINTLLCVIVNTALVLFAALTGFTSSWCYPDTLRRIIERIPLYQLLSDCETDMNYDPFSNQLNLFD